MPDFTPEQELAIQAKIKLFKPFVKPGLPIEERVRIAKEIERAITEKRTAWYEAHKHQLPYAADPSLDKLAEALHLLFVEYMRADKVSYSQVCDDTEAIFQIRIESRGFCPYLEAFKRLGINARDSAWLCQNVLERPCQSLVERLDPRIRFSRDYRHIRPLADSCSETLTMRNPELLERMLIAAGEDPDNYPSTYQ